METLFHLTRIAHARRVFCYPKKDKKKIILSDLKRALELFVNDDTIKKRGENFTMHTSMYM